MKERKLLDAIGMADEKYVSEAAPTGKKRLRHPFYIAIAACLCVVLAVSVVGVTMWNGSDEPEKGNNDSNIEQSPIENNGTEDSIGEDGNQISDYSGVIKVLDNYYDYLNSLPPSNSGGTTDDDGDFAQKQEQYVEVTDNQEQGIVEGDLIKRSDHYVYSLYMQHNYNSRQNRVFVSVYSIAGVSSKKEAVLEIENEFSSIYDMQLYLSADCQTIAVILSGYSQDRAEKNPSSRGFYAEAYAYDVSDVTNICVKGKWSTESGTLETRLVGNDLILVTSWNVTRKKNFDDLIQFVPHYDVGEGLQFVPADKIFYSEDTLSAKYFVVSKLDINSFELTDVVAMMGHYPEMYFAEDVVYMQGAQHGKILINGLQYSGSEDMKLLGSVEVKGSVQNQYSMDEHEGILRLVTDEGLYCISLDDWTIKASVLGFVPEGEDVKSVRFDGDYAYVCTAVVEEEILDPVFFFDLSDLSNITYKQTEEIPGFSHSLVNFGGGYLLGIGYDEDRRGKIEIYRESENGVESVCQYIANGWISGDYKAFYIDRENQQIGFAVKGGRYVILEFDGESLVVNQDVVFTTDNIQQTRTFMDDGYLYLFNKNQFKLIDLDESRADSSNGYLSVSDTNLEFWIDQDVSGVEFDWKHSVPYEEKTYLGSKYSIVVENNERVLPEHYVYYQLSNNSSTSVYVNKIYITDPTVTVYGLTIESERSKIIETIEQEGFVIRDIMSSDMVVATKVYWDRQYVIYFTANSIRIEVKK